MNRIKSFLWRGGSLAVVAGGAYVLQIGDIYKLDSHTLINLVVIAVIGLVVAEATKYLNS